MKAISIKLVFIVLGAVFCSQHSLYSGEKESPLPNIVFFFCDDLGYADLGVYGHPYAKTPALDKLSTESTRFEQHYVTGVTCNPSRTGLMTGRFPARAAKYASFHGFGDWISITELLKERGYRTGHFGKWHIGPKETEVSGMYGLDVVDVIGKSKDPAAGRDDDLTTAAIKFMRENAGKQPFYVNVWGHSTHFPVSVNQSLASEFIEVKVKRSDFSDTMQKKFDECIQIGGDLDESMRQYLGDVYSVDRNVARLLKAIDELGIRDNTIFVFSSDHGPAPVILAKGWREFSNNMLGYAGIFRGAKHNQFEGGVRVPFIIRWPGHVPAGRVDSESVTSFIDWMPTIAAITGIENLPEELDGEDISSIWFGESRERTKPLFWKTSSANSRPSMRDGKWKLHAVQGNKFELYDLSVDPEESKNVVKDHPDVFADMKQKLDAWLDQLPEDYIKDG
ncbi:MAG: sulfatase [Puniceicoccaceae bacterium]